jgi:hypothetical protein
MKVNNVIPKRIDFPGNSNLANAKPAKALVRPPTPTVTHERITEFLSPVRNPNLAKRSAYGWRVKSDGTKASQLNGREWANTE